MSAWRPDREPPEAAIAALRARGLDLRPSGSWQELYGAEHAVMGTVAQSAGHDILADIWAALEQALADGETVERFSKRLRPVLEAKGWWGRQPAIDRATGEAKLVQLGSARRLRLIFETNMRVSHAAGHWARFDSLKDEMPFLRYVAIRDDRTRPSHLALHNLVLPVDHPFWKTHAPPNGWNCRCTLQQLSARDVKDLMAAGEVLRFDAPEITTRPFVNKVTGEIVHVPDGIDPGWEYNPGLEGYKAVRAIAEAKSRSDLFPAAVLPDVRPPNAQTVALIGQTLNRAQEAWSASLVDAERAAINDYKGRMHRLMNVLLRHGGEDFARLVGGMGYRLQPSVENSIRLLEGALHRNRLEHPLVVYRGIKTTPRLRIGDTWTDPAFSSTSLSLETAQKFGDLILEYHLKPGQSGAYINDVPSVRYLQYEFLLPPGVTFRIIGRRHNRWILEVK